MCQVEHNPLPTRQKGLFHSYSHRPIASCASTIVNPYLDSRSNHRLRCQSSEPHLDSDASSDSSSSSCFDHLDQSPHSRSLNHHLRSETAVTIKRNPSHHAHHTLQPSCASAHPLNLVKASLSPVPLIVDSKLTHCLVSPNLDPLQPNPSHRYHPSTNTITLPPPLLSQSICQNIYPPYQSDHSELVREVLVDSHHWSGLDSQNNFYHDETSKIMDSDPTSTILWGLINLAQRIIDAELHHELRPSS